MVIFTLTGCIIYTNIKSFVFVFFNRNPFMSFHILAYILSCLLMNSTNTHIPAEIMKGIITEREGQGERNFLGMEKKTF